MGGERSSLRSSKMPQMRTSLSGSASMARMSCSAVLAAADDHRAPLETSGFDPLANETGESQAEAGEDKQAGDVPGSDPDARKGVADLGEEGDHGEEDEDHRPGKEDAAELKGAAAERNDRISVGELDHDDGGERPADQRRRVPPGEAVGGSHIGEVGDGADEEHGRELDQASEAGKQDRRDRAARQAGRDQARGNAQRRVAGDIGRCFNRSGAVCTGRHRDRGGVVLVHLQASAQPIPIPGELPTGPGLRSACSDH